MMKQSSKLVILLFLSFFYVAVDAQTYQPEVITTLDFRPEACHIAKDGSIYVVTSFKRDTVIGIDTLNFSEFGGIQSIHDNFAFVAYDPSGNPRKAFRIPDFNDMGSAWVTQDKEIYTITREGKYRVFDTTGIVIRESSIFQLVDGTNLKNGSFSTTDIFVRSNNDFVISTLMEVGSSGETIVALNNGDTLRSPARKMEGYHFLITCDSDGDVKSGFFAMGENACTADNISQYQRSLWQRGDSIWFFEGTYLKPGILFQGDQYYGDAQTHYQGVLMLFVNGKMEDFTFHRLKKPQYPNKIWNNIETRNYFSISPDGKRLAVETNSHGMSAFNTANFENYVWQKWQLEFDEKITLFQFAENAPWFSSTGLIHLIGNVMRDLPYFSDIYEVNDIVFTAINPDNGSIVNHSKVASNVWQNEAFPIGEDGNGNPYLFLLANNPAQDGEYSRYKNIKIANQNYPVTPTNSLRSFIIRMKKVDESPASIMLNSECYNGKVQVITDPVIVADSIIVNWGDSLSSSCTNCYKLNHKYKNVGDFKVTTTVYSGAEKSIFNDTASIPWLNNLFLKDDTLICEESAILELPDVKGLSYYWNNDQTGTKLKIDTGGNYIVRAEFDSCVVYDTIEVLKDDDFPESLLPDSAWMCDHQQKLNIIKSVPAATTWRWSTSSTDSSITVHEPGTYSIQAITPNNCKVEDSVVVMDAGDSLRGNFFEYEVINRCKDAVVELKALAPPNYRVKWDDGYYGHIRKIDEGGMFKIEVSGHCGTGQDSVEIITEDCECRQFIPTAFTPNSDQMNDEFTVTITNCGDRKFDIQIFDRWGSKIFSGKATDKWDGTLNGEFVPDGEYMYILSGGNKVLDTGTIQLIR